MGRAWGSVAATMVLAAGFSVRPVAASGAVPAPLAPQVLPMAQEYYWEWSDGSRKATRTFSQAEYGMQSNLPHLVVTAVPARPSHEVLLQYYQDGEWFTENEVPTNSRGIASIDIDPYCRDDDWCDSTFKYRLKVDGQTARLRITYSTN